jgi:protein gp37
MAENSAIEWTDHTVNFWWGCTKVGPGCDHCYAETLSRRFDGAGADGQSTIWGPTAPRRQIKAAVAAVQRIDRKAAASATRPWVFTQSMADLFDNDVPLEWFAEAWAAIKAARNLRWQIVTKRISNVERRLAVIGETEWPDHVGLMVTVVNQDEAARDVPRLLRLKGGWNLPWAGLSMEPLLGPVDLTALTLGFRRVQSLPDRLNALTGVSDCGHGEYEDVFETNTGPRLDWVVVGGESGAGARPMHPDWARSLRDQCAAAGVPFFFKQWGKWVHESQDLHGSLFDWGDAADRGILHYWSDDGTSLIPVAKALDPKTLDGIIHDAWPEVAG